MSSPKDKAIFLVHLLNSNGQGDYIGERVSQLEHSLQAAHLAALNNADDETVIAALLHDIGHFLPAEQIRSIAHEVRNMNSHDDTSVGGVGRIGHERRCWTNLIGRSSYSRMDRELAKRENEGMGNLQFSAQCHTRGGNDRVLIWKSHAHTIFA